MKTVILAAGKGTRMGELTKDTPKPLLKYRGKTLIEHKLDRLPEKTSEVIIVVGYEGDKIKNYFGSTFKEIPIQYVEQGEMLGTADALYKAKHLLNEPFLVLMGDDLYSKEDLETLTSQGEWAVLVEETKELKSGGKLIIDEANHLKDIVEDFEGNIPYNLVYTGACFLTPEVFDLEMAILPGKKEYGLPQTFAKAATTRKIKIIHATFWKRVTSPEDLLG